MFKDVIMNTKQNILMKLPQMTTSQVHHMYKQVPMKMITGLFHSCLILDN